MVISTIFIMPFISKLFFKFYLYQIFVCHKYIFFILLLKFQVQNFSFCELCYYCYLFNLITNHKYELIYPLHDLNTNKHGKLQDNIIFTNSISKLQTFSYTKLWLEYKSIVINLMSLLKRNNNWISSLAF